MKAPNKPSNLPISNMSISMLGTLPPVKGISDYCAELVQALSKHHLGNAENNVEVDFISFKRIYPEFLYPGGTKDPNKKFDYQTYSNVHERSIITYYNPFSWAWAGLSSKSKILHVQWWTTVLAPMFFTSMLFAKLRRKKIIMTVHNVVGHESSWVDRLVSRIIFKFPDYFILHSENSIVQFNKFVNAKSEKVRPDRIFKIPHGILDMYKDNSISREDARLKLGIKQDAPVILCFGNIREYKGVDIMIEAFAMIKQKMPNTILIIAGKSWIDWTPNQALIDKHKLKDSIITYLDYVPSNEVSYYFRASDVVALPYKHFDSQSGPGNIALAFHTPLVVTDQGGLPDLLKNKEFVIKTNDVDALAQKTIKILKDKKLADSLSRDAEDLCKEFSWESVAKKTAELYDHVSNS
jgi:glycosyltransferase involved in cell wall biosynthesis